MLTDDMLFGILLGLVLAVVLGIVFWWLLWSRDHIHAFFAPQRVTQQTGRTPAQVFVGCVMGVLALGLFGVVVWLLMQELS